MDTIQGQIRALLAGLFGGLIAKGLASPEQVEQLVQLILGAGGLLFTMAWSALSKTLESVLTRVAKSPDVEKIVVNDPELAVAVPSEKVVSDVAARGF